MKNLLTTVLMITAISLSAQPFQKNKERQNLTPDQIAELQTKRMTLRLELNESQQQQILKINKKNAQERKLKMEKRKALREKGEKRSNEEVFKIKNNRLDNQIAHQSEMKDILNEQQFETWKKTRDHRAYDMKKRAVKHKRAKTHKRLNQKRG